MVIPISTATNTAGRPIKTGLLPTALVVTPNGKTLYVTNVDSGTVTPISTATNTAGKAIKVGKSPLFIAVTPNGDTVFVVSYGRTAGIVVPIATSTNTAGKAIEIKGTQPGGMAIAP